MVKLEYLEKRNVVVLYELIEQQWLNPHPGLQAHGVDERTDVKNLFHGYFASQKNAEPAILALSSQRTQEGYSKLCSFHGFMEQTKPEAEKLRGLQFEIRKVEVDSREVSKGSKGEARFKEELIK